MIEFIQSKITSLIHGFGLDHFPWEVMYFSLGVTLAVLLVELFLSSVWLKEFLFLWEDEEDEEESGEREL